MGSSRPRRDGNCPTIDASVRESVDLLLSNVLCIPVQTVPAARQFYSLLLRNIGHGRLRLGVLFRPGPGVSKPCLQLQIAQIAAALPSVPTIVTRLRFGPGLWEQAQLCLLGAAVVGCDLHLALQAFRHGVGGCPWSKGR